MKRILSRNEKALKNKNYFDNNYGVVIFVVAGVLIIPQLYYLSNVEEFSYDIALLSFPLVLSLSILIFSKLFPIGQRMQLFLAGVGLSILMCDWFFGADIHSLDGSSKAILIDPYIGSLNVLLYFGLPIFLWFFGKKLNKPLVALSFVLAFLAVGLLIFSVAFTAYVYTDESRATVDENSEWLAARHDKNLPNIYFIWLDAMGTEYMKKYVSDSGTAAQESFAGFTLFENNTANYLYTLQSYVSFMSGTVFKEHVYANWKKQSDNLRQDLINVGYRTTAYAKKNYLSALDDRAISSEETFLNWTSIKHPYIADFVSYWIVRSLPAFLANYSLKGGEHAGGVLHTLINQESEYLHVKSISDGIEPLTGVFTLKQIIKDEKYRGVNREFVIAQAIIPHGPYVIDKNCNYRGPVSGSTDDAYFEQVVCSANLVKDFLKELKSLDRYDSSLIIIMGDHGSGQGGLIGGVDDSKEPLNKEYVSWNKSMVIQRASSLLMIKLPQSAADTGLSMSDKESQLIDIYPTILSSIGYAEKIPNDIDGVDLFNDGIVNRAKYITYFKPAKIISPDIAEIYDFKYSRTEGVVDLIYRSGLMESNDLPNIRCNQKIYFSSSKDAEFYLSHGLSGIEKWGRWSDGELVTLKLVLPKNECDKSLITFNLNGFVKEEYLVQSSVVLLNDTVIGEIDIRFNEDNLQEFTFNIPPGLVKPGNLNVFEFKVLNPMSPKSLGLSEDPRLLGIGFKSVTFH